MGVLHRCKIRRFISLSKIVLWYLPYIEVGMTMEVPGVFLVSLLKLVELLSSFVESSQFVSSYWVHLRSLKFFLSITALTNMFGTPSGPEALFSGKVLALSTSSLVVTSSIFSELFCTIQSTRGRVWNSPYIISFMRWSFRQWEARNGSFTN